MQPADTLEKVFLQIEKLLEEQREMVLSGNADALPESGSQLAALLQQAGRCAGESLAPAQRQCLGEIQKQVRALGCMLNRRQSDVQRRLDAFGRSNRQINDMQTCKVYAPAGLMVSSLSTRAVASA